MPWLLLVTYTLSEELGIAYHRAISHIWEHGDKIVVVTNNITLDTFLKDISIFDSFNRLRVTSRSLDIFNIKKRKTCPVVTEKPCHEKLQPLVASLSQEIAQTVSTLQDRLTSVFIKRCLEHYPQLQFNTTEQGVMIDTQGLHNPRRLMQLLQDLQFYQRQVHLPLENVFCHFANYREENPIHQRLAQRTQKLSRYAEKYDRLGLWLSNNLLTGLYHFSHLAYGLYNSLSTLNTVRCHTPPKTRFRVC